MTKNIFSLQNMLHYVLLAFGVYLWHEIPFNEFVEQLYISNQIIGLPMLILWWTLGLFTMDTLIHLFFASLPEPYKWDD